MFNLGDGVMLSYLQNAGMEGLGGPMVDQWVLAGGNPNLFRKYCGPDGKGTYVTVFNGFKSVKDERTGELRQVPQYKPKLVSNAPSLLTRDAWKAFDTVVTETVRDRMRVVSDLRGAGMQYVVPGGMAKTVLENQTLGDLTDATMGMNPAKRSEFDRPEVGLAGLPLPLVWKDLQFNMREILASRQGFAPLDTTSIRLATEIVLEKIEKVFIGVETWTQPFGGYTLYGMRNHPDRIIKNNITAPTAGGWTPATLINELIVMRGLARTARHRGPWFLYFSDDWDVYLDRDYSSSYPGVSLRDRIKTIEGWDDVRTLDFLTGAYEILMVGRSAMNRAVIIQEPTTIRWEELGGQELNLKVLAGIVPQFKVDTEGNADLVHGTTS